MMRFPLAMLIAWLVGTGAVRADITSLDTPGLRALIAKGVSVVDVRREDEWRATGVIPGATLLTFFDARGNYDARAWLAQLDAIVDRDEPVVLICQQGVRSLSIARLLDKRLGYTAVHNHTGGMNDWLREGGEVVRYPHQGE